MRQNYDYKALVHTLCSKTVEEDWFEFKSGNSNPERIGQHISALSNSAALSQHTYGYLLWGVDDQSHKVVGTVFRPETATQGTMELKAWLAVNLTVRTAFDFIPVEMEEGKTVVILEVAAAESQPVAFKGNEYIRIGSTMQELRRHPAIERELWKCFMMHSAELEVCEGDLSGDMISQFLSFDDYFTDQGLPIPSSYEGKLAFFSKEHFVVQEDNGKFGITALGALLYARNLALFPTLASKRMRIITYADEGKLHAIDDHTAAKGYALCFEEAVSRVVGAIKKPEHIGPVYREESCKLPPVAVREAIANALIHQDLSIAGSGPLVEIFSNRVDISSPGQLLVERDRLIDAPPAVRNEALAAFLRRMHICEERGSGFDRIEEAMGARKLPSALVESGDSFTRVSLSWAEDFRQWSLSDKLRTIYSSACLDHISRRATTNASLRSRLGLDEASSAVVSRLAKDAVERGMLKLEDPDAGTKARRYLPYWA